MDFKIFVRTLFKLDYISNVFGTSKLFEDNQEQRLMIMDKFDNEINKHEMNERGTFYVFSVNSIHAPDSEVSTTINELMILNEVEILLFLLHFLESYILQSSLQITSCREEN